MKRIELLSPAGNMDSLIAAVQAGCDAVYLGGTLFGARAFAGNFNDDEIIEAIKYCHLYGVKVYVTTNILIYEHEVDKFLRYIEFLHKHNVDAVLIQDLGMLDLVHKTFPNLECHASTQMHIHNLDGVIMANKLGCKRVVLARECTREDIIDIKKNVDTEIEVFIHGAMCTSYSGRCVMSNYVTLRDSNRGGCSQVCRFSFDCGEDEDYAFSSKDLNMIDYLPDMMKIGVESYKIEGRMKSLYYIATVDNAYRTIMDKVIDNSLTQEDMDYYKKVLNRVSNRENIAQFYDGTIDENAQYYTGRQEISNQDFLAFVKSYNKKDKSMIVEQRNKFSVGDEVEVFGPNTKVRSFKIDFIQNEDNEYMESSCHAQEIVKINAPFEVKEGDSIRIKI